MRDISVVCVCAVLAACAPTGKGDEGGGGSAIPFVFSSFLEPAFEVRVTDPGGNPLAGVSVTVEDVHQVDLTDDSARGHAVYLRGLTDDDGLFSGTAKLPRGVESVDVVVHDDAGRTGPWTDSALRDAQGDFAPSSRQTRAVGSAGIEMVVALAEDVL